MSLKILCVDDDQDILELISTTLKKEMHTVYTANDGIEAIELFQKVTADIVLLDIMMPGMDGIDVCKNIRSSSHNPYIVFITAKSDEIDQILALEVGADDYIVKPFSPKVLKTKIKAIKRRLSYSQENITNHNLKIDGLEVDKKTYTVKVDGKEVRFLRKEFELLYYMMSKKNMVHTREQLLTDVWGEDAYFVDRTVDVHITKIRKKLKPYNHIVTVSGVGYKFKD